MSSILIKGMEMPKTCGKCDFYETYRDMVTGEVIFECKRKATVVEHPFTQRDKNCPLIELPPHSDLIDRNKLLRRAKKESTYAWKMNLHARTETILNQFIDWLDEAPTVIEAEGETDGR